MTELDAIDLAHLAHAIDLARAARARGDHPFGAILVVPDDLGSAAASGTSPHAGRIIEALNSVVTQSDPTGHAETNLVRAAAAALPADVLSASVLYTSTEPCAMCAGAIYWAGIPKVVYALGEDELIRIVDAQEGIPTLALPCREVFARGGRSIDVVGPVPLPDATTVHAGFWTGEHA